MDDRNGNTLWKIVGPVALSVILTMGSAYFLFARDVATKSDIDKIVIELRSVDSQMWGEVRSIKSKQDERGPQVQEIPQLRERVTKLEAATGDMRVIQNDLSHVKRTVDEMRRLVERELFRRGQVPKELE